MAVPVPVTLDHCVIRVTDWAPGNSDPCFVWDGPLETAIDHLRSSEVPVELGPVTRNGARDEGTSVYFRDPDGSLVEFIAYR